ncbi:MAG: DUF1080 domain-containing protein [Planctomycetaceae bacterium]|jgi:hypothetical protein|nr:DUF1080 domain-containing protein [Planctomycetaceae bacterium]
MKENKHYARRLIFIVVMMNIAGTLLFGQEKTAESVPAKQNAPKWKSLFDGKTLDGWKAPEDTTAGQVKVESGCIVLGQGDLSTGIKYVKPFPKTNYEITYQAKRVKGYDFFGTITFPVKDSFCSFVNGGWGGGTIGLSSINGYDASENETSSYYSFKDDEWYQFRVCVSDDRITVWVNALEDKSAEKQEPEIDVTLKEKEISIRIEVNPYKPLGFTSWVTEGWLRDIKYRELTQEEIKAIHKK